MYKYQKISMVPPIMDTHMDSDSCFNKYLNFEIKLSIKYFKSGITVGRVGCDLGCKKTIMFNNFFE